ncbi:unnamed protein product [Rotaria socialis]|uniref:Uncharacterized protein n=1 Tax=Rotaria socialis TaxID=392032 RepID=A0A817Z6M3_9BILA|nr:unnamed protein product [Rotaria socialis]
MTAWLRDNPQGKQGRHTYNLAEYGLNCDDIEARPILNQFQSSSNPNQFLPILNRFRPIPIPILTNSRPILNRPRPIPIPILTNSTPIPTNAGQFQELNGLELELVHLYAHTQWMFPGE